VSLDNPFFEHQRYEFLRPLGWSGCQEHQISGDWTQRQFFRIEKDGRKAIVMQSVPDDDPRMTPGHRMADFVKVSNYLRKLGLSAPEIYNNNARHGLLLVEDFGDQNFLSMIKDQPSRELDLYLLGTNALKHIYQKTKTIGISLPDYHDSHIHKGLRRVVDWYIPAVKHQKNSAQLVQEYLSIWKEIEKSLPPFVRRMILGDYHPENLIWLPVRQDVRQAGLIDFQQAMSGPAVYDIVNFLEDARREVPNHIRVECLSLYLSDLSHDEQDSIVAWYPVLAGQFHCRVIGQAIRLAIKSNKVRLLEYLPILRRHMIRDLSSPVLKPLQDWFLAQGIDFHHNHEIDLRKTSEFIADDAY
jgi:aminoglycoside/choline kinase family phosphotransferase